MRRYAKIYFELPLARLCIPGTTEAYSMPNLTTEQYNTIEFKYDDTKFKRVEI